MSAPEWTEMPPDENPVGDGAWGTQGQRDRLLERSGDIMRILETLTDPDGHHIDDEGGCYLTADNLRKYRKHWRYVRTGER